MGDAGVYVNCNFILMITQYLEYVLSTELTPNRAADALVFAVSTEVL